MRHADTTCTTGRQQSVRETLMYSVWRTCSTFIETVEDERAHSCFKKSSRLAKRNNCAFSGGSVLNASFPPRADAKDRCTARQGLLTNCRHVLLVDTRQNCYAAGHERARPTHYSPLPGLRRHQCLSGIHAAARKAAGSLAGGLLMRTDLTAMVRLARGSHPGVEPQPGQRQ